ncbi:starch phosphorylase [Peribacillus deserti]|uniref:Alpha-1,4 glucan phosphorylase n=1 Tax=Peribacillus deserti TaxID=673318 RepID=A0ABS2QIN0_9BACI|nr:glycogen/starch/alpha-glucan phosphorylase [Peribacillus deserti]MBM7692992.1 starch phosphorylase [Peribacillus deserti]
MFSDKEQFKELFLRKLEMTYGKSVEETCRRDQFHVLGMMVREYISKDWIESAEKARTSKSKQIYYLSIEFLPGRFLGNNLLNLGITELLKEGLDELGIDLSDIEDIEADAGLGNGGLGRLAACFLDSLASLSLPGHGCGIRYKHGLFEQKFVDGFQVELPEQWLSHGFVWEVRKPDLAEEIPFWGTVESYSDGGRLKFRHIDAVKVLAVPYDVPVVGYQNKTVNTLRLWSAEPALVPWQKDIMKYKRETEAVTEFLYPNDTHDEGKILRLKQQYFLVAATLKSIMGSFRKKYNDIHLFHEKIGLHINDTHPVLAIPELMRILIDEENLTWDDAWNITTKCISYTNHTTLSEALEKWPVRILEPLLPRIYMIIHEINERYCQDLWAAYPGNWNHIEQMAIIAHGEVKMAHLAIAGSFSVNGVAKLHTEILKNREMKNFFDFYPSKFNNKTNGITHRRWLMKANPELCGLITEAIGEEWKSSPEQLELLNPYYNDNSFLGGLRDVKKIKKHQLADRIYKNTGLRVNVDSIFDVQVKRLHAYKRQLLNVFHIMHLYNRMKEDKHYKPYPRTFIFGAKASPGYYYAKKVIKLINSVAEKVNNDRDVNSYIQVVFLENYNVSLAEEIFPATEVSEQISTASKEASGTGNMKFMMNGAVTIGTLDGANVEMEERLGPENIFIFGLNADQVISYLANGGYSPYDYYHGDERIQLICNQLINGFFPNSSEHFETIFDSLLTENDQFFVLRDFASYISTQRQVEEAYQDQASWSQKSLKNIAMSGFFSSDRTVKEYADEIWNIKPL